jgi:hypothetical protein
MGGLPELISNQILLYDSNTYVHIDSLMDKQKQARSLSIVLEIFPDKPLPFAVEGANRLMC